MPRDTGVKIAFVTHLYAFARGCYDRDKEDVLFLRAERSEDGVRTFRMIPRDPLQTSFGQDLYRHIIGE